MMSTIGASSFTAASFTAGSFTAASFTAARLNHDSERGGRVRPKGKMDRRRSFQPGERQTSRIGFSAESRLQTRPRIESPSNRLPSGSSDR